jgi:Co/Zn/Cd efflux system component
MHKGVNGDARVTLPTADIPRTGAHEAHGCCGQTVTFDGASPAYRRVLGLVIGINAVAFVAVGGGALVQGSAALGANALDFLADSATYALSLWAIGRSVRVRSGAALLKGASLCGLALGILGFAIWRAVTGTPLEGGVITGLGLFGFAANALAALLLLRFRNGDANVRSVWLCTRNDLVHSLTVAGAGALVLVTGSRWPDLIAGVLLAGLFLQSAVSIVRQSRAELKAA